MIESLSSFERDSWINPANEGNYDIVGASSYSSGRRGWINPANEGNYDTQMLSLSQLHKIWRICWINPANEGNYDTNTPFSQLPSTCWINPANEGNYDQWGWCRSSYAGRLRWINPANEGNYDTTLTGQPTQGKKRGVELIPLTKGITTSFLEK